MKVNWMQRLSSNWAAKILSLVVALILFFLNGISSLEERYITVTVQLETPAGLTVLNRSVTRLPVTLRGNSDGIWTIGEDDIVLSADFSDIQDEGTFRRSLTINRKGQAVSVDPLEIIPEQTYIEVELQKLASKNVAVSPEFRGHPSIGYEMGIITVVPNTVSISGPRSIVEAVDQLNTAAIDASGRTETFSQRVNLDLPDSRLLVLGSNQVEVRMVIEEAVTSTIYRGVEIVVQNIPEFLELSTFVLPGIIRIQGAQLLMEQIRTDQLRLVVDASGVTEVGTRVLSLRPQVPGGVLVLDYSPTEIELEFLDINDDRESMDSEQEQ